MRIKLPFQPRWRGSVLDGSKTTTVRSKRYGHPHDDFEIDGAAFRLTAVDGMTLDAARDAVWREEGMTSPEEFTRIWTENHPGRGYRGSDQVWVHRFQRT